MTKLYTSLQLMRQMSQYVCHDHLVQPKEVYNNSQRNYLIDCHVCITALVISKKAKCILHFGLTSDECLLCCSVSSVWWRCTIVLLGAMDHWSRGTVTMLNVVKRCWMVIIDSDISLSLTPIVHSQCSIECCVSNTRNGVRTFVRMSIHMTTTRQPPTLHWQ